MHCPTGTEPLLYFGSKRLVADSDSHGQLAMIIGKASGRYCNYGLWVMGSAVNTIQYNPILLLLLLLLLERVT